MPFIGLDQIAPRAVESLWPGRLPLGHLVLVDGDPGLGKSLVTLELCARLTTGRPFPDGAASGRPATVIVVNAEDRARDTIHSRLRAAGADPARVTLWDRAPGEPWLRLPGQLERLDDTLSRTAARLVVIDPLTAFLEAGISLSSDHLVRQALAPLADLADARRCVIMPVRHLTKEAG